LRLISNALAAVAVIAVTTLSLQGCDSMGGLSNVAVRQSGRQVSDGELALFHDRYAHEADVMRELGQPSRKQMVGSRDRWFYDYSRTSASGDLDTESTVFEFDANALLLAHSRLSRNHIAGNGRGSY
jgi:hypothetical protein